MRLWRVARAARARSGAEAFSGEGGLFAAGRWHSRGRRIVYTAQSESLAKLETLVHFNSALAPALVLVEAELPDDCVLPLGARLPSGWDASPDTGAARPLGDRWLVQGASLALAVPSIHSRSERNVLVNPAHPDFARVTIGAPVAFLFDRRLHDPSAR